MRRRILCLSDLTMSWLDPWRFRGLNRTVRALILSLLALVSSLAAQEIDVLAVPPAPEGRILDDARLFSLEPQVLERLSTRLSRISERTGYEVYVAIFDSLISSDVREQSVILRDEWIGERPGVMLVLESDSSIYELSWSRTPDKLMGSGEMVPMLSESDLPPQEEVRIINALSNMQTEQDSSTRSAELLITTFSEGIDVAFKKVEASEPGRWNVRVLMLGTGLLAGMLLIGFLIGAVIRRWDRKVEERLVFPEVTVGVRPGAQCGGGKISSRSFDVLSPDGKI